MLAITGETIAAIGDLSRSEARRVIDATGMTVAPGFIDTHTHSEGALLTDPQHAYGLRQGITTEFLGIDGMSYAPLSPSQLPNVPPLADVACWATLRYDLDMSSVKAFRQPLSPEGRRQHGVPRSACHRASPGAGLSGHAAPSGVRLPRPDGLSGGIEQGAVGLLDGLPLLPRPMGRHHGAGRAREDGARGRWRLHVRASRGEPGPRPWRHGCLEALEVARQSGVRLHFAHYRTGPATAGRIDRIMEHIDVAKERRRRHHLRHLSLSGWQLDSAELLPGAAQEGGPEAILRRLSRSVAACRIAEPLNTEHGAALEETIFSSLPTNRTWRG